MPSQLELQRISVRYGEFTAVQELSVRLEQGQIDCLLGPSGCGKTSVLRAIAGFEPVSGGEIRLHGALLSARGYTLPPESRKVGMVFQDFALFPHLNVARNIGFGLRSAGRASRARRIEEMLELVGLSDLQNAWPHQLSGGQQQRVALARALAPAPELLLLDEPFSSLDAELREQLAAEVRELLKRTGVTAVLVTHDQHEAFAMADHIHLLRGGRLVQADTPYNLYHQPANEFVAGFIGQSALIDISVDDAGQLQSALGGPLPEPPADWSPGQALRLLIRPDDIQYDAHSSSSLLITGKTFRGAQYLYELALPDGQRVPCLTPSHIDLAINSMLPVRVDLRHAMIFGGAVNATE